MSFRTRRRQGLGLRPVNRIKHVIDGQFGVPLNVAQNVILIEANDNPAIANTAEVQTGSTINGIYFKAETYARTSAALSNIYMGIIKNPGNNISMPNPNVVGSNDNKKYFIHQEMVMLERSVNGNPRTIFNSVVVIPRGYRRFGPEDNLIAKFIAPGVDVDLCIQCHYKEFR